MYFRNLSDYIESALLTAKDRLKALSEKNKRQREYNEKIKKRVKK